MRSTVMKQTDKTMHLKVKHDVRADYRAGNGLGP